MAKNKTPKKRQKQSSPAADDAAAAAGAPPFATTTTTTDLTEKDSTIDSTSAATTNDATIDTGAAVATTTDMATKDPTIDASAPASRIATNTDLTGKIPTIDTRAATTKDTTFNTNTAMAKTANLTSDIDERKLLYRIPKKATNTTLPDINKVATMTGTPIGATSPTGSDSDHDSSEYVAEKDDLGQTIKGNKKVSIIYDMFLIPKWN